MLSRYFKKWEDMTSDIEMQLQESVFWGA